MTNLKDLGTLYLVNITFSGQPEQLYSPRLAAMVKLFSGWHAVVKSGLIVPLLEEPPVDADIERKEARIYIPHCEAHLCRLHRFYTGKTQGDCEEFTLPHMHFKGGGIEDVGALQGGLYIPSIARESALDEKMRRILEESAEESVA
jgi:hypothetical protein